MIGFVLKHPIPKDRGEMVAVIEHACSQIVLVAVQLLQNRPVM